MDLALNLLSNSYLQSYRDGLDLSINFKINMENLTLNSDVVQDIFNFGKLDSLIYYLETLENDLYHEKSLWIALEYDPTSAAQIEQLRSSLYSEINKIEGMSDYIWMWFLNFPEQEVKDFTINYFHNEILLNMKEYIASVRQCLDINYGCEIVQ